MAPTALDPYAALQASRLEFRLAGPERCGPVTEEEVAMYTQRHSIEH